MSAWVDSNERGNASILCTNPNNSLSNGKASSIEICAGVLDQRVLQYRKLFDARDSAYLSVLVVRDIRSIRDKCCAKLP